MAPVPGGAEHAEALQGAGQGLARLAARVGLFEEAIHRSHSLEEKRCQKGVVCRDQGRSQGCGTAQGGQGPAGGGGGEGRGKGEQGEVGNGGLDVTRWGKRGVMCQVPYGAIC